MVCSAWLGQSVAGHFALFLTFDLLRQKNRRPSITASALSRDTSTPAGWERGEGRPRRSSQILDAARGSPS